MFRGPSYAYIVWEVIGICVVWGVGRVLSKMINIIEGMLEYEIILSDITQTKISKHVRKQQNVLIFFSKQHL